MANISVTNALNDNSATSDITLVGTNFTDLVNGLTDGTKDISISQITISSKSLMADGTVAAPSYAFTNDTDCGLYRIGANNIGLGVNGAKVLDVSTGGLEVTGTLKATTKLILNTISALTVSSGVVTATASYHEIYGEGATTDDLDTINGGTAGQILVIRNAATGYVLTAKDGTGNLILAGDFAFSSADLNSRLLLISNGTNWYELSRSAN